MLRKLEMIWLLITAHKAVLITDIDEDEYFILSSENVTEEDLAVIHESEWEDAYDN